MKTKTKETALSSFRQYNKNPQQNLSKAELAALTNLSENKDIVIQKSDKGNSVVNSVRKPTFSGVYSNFESFLPSVYKFGMVYTLVYRCFRISSNWTQFHTELTFLRGIFRKNGYPENFIDKFF